MCHEPSAMCHGCFVVALPSLGRIRFNTDEARCRGTMSPTWSGQGECSYEGEWRMSRKASRSAWSSKLSLLGWRRLSRWVRFARRLFSSSLCLESDSPDHYQPNQPRHTPTQPNPILSYPSQSNLTRPLLVTTPCTAAKAQNIAGVYHYDLDVSLTLPAHRQKPPSARRRRASRSRNRPPRRFLPLRSRRGGVSVL
jgi:hypothetical protein